VEGSGAIEFVGEEGRGTLTFSIMVGFLAWNKSLNVRGSHLERKYIGKLKKKKKTRRKEGIESMKKANCCLVTQRTFLFCLLPSLFPLPSSLLLLFLSSYITYQPDKKKLIFFLLMLFFFFK
jgi:hypothetical protein